MQEGDRPRLDARGIPTSFHNCDLSFILKRIVQNDGSLNDLMSRITGMRPDNDSRVIMLLGKICSYIIESRFRLYVEKEESLKSHLNSLNGSAGQVSDGAKRLNKYVKRLIQDTIPNQVFADFMRSSRFDIMSILCKFNDSDGSVDALRSIEAVELLEMRVRDLT